MAAVDVARVPVLLACADVLLAVFVACVLDFDEVFLAWVEVLDAVSLVCALVWAAALSALTAARARVLTSSRRSLATTFRGGSAVTRARSTVALLWQ